MSGAGWVEREGPGGLRWFEPVRSPPGVRIATLLRSGGVSPAPYASLNLALHVGDDEGAVAENRRRARAALALPSAPCWLRQVHGARIARGRELGMAPEADGASSVEPGRVLAVLTADCLPVVLAAGDGGEVAIAHAGWRGLAGGVLEAALAALASPAREVSAWIAPGIGPAAYLVGSNVRDAFARSPGAAEGFSEAGSGRWHCDLAALATARLRAAGVRVLAQRSACTWSDATRFYSYRRDGETGRMATFVWREPTLGREA